MYKLPMNCDYKLPTNCAVDDDVQEAVWRSVFFRVEWSLGSTLNSAVYRGLGGSLNAAVFRAVNDATWHDPEHPGLQDYLSEVKRAAE